MKEVNQGTFSYLLHGTNQDACKTGEHDLMWGKITFNNRFNNTYYSPTKQNGCPILNNIVLLTNA